MTSGVTSATCMTGRRPTLLNYLLRTGNMATQSRYLFMSTQMGPNGTGWGFTVLFNFASGLTRDDEGVAVHDQLHGFMCGAGEQDETVYDMEIRAVLMALIWLGDYCESSGLDRHCTKAYFHIDNTACLATTQLNSAQAADDKASALVTHLVHISNISIEAIHVKSHKEILDPWNEMADALARQGAKTGCIVDQSARLAAWEDLKMENMPLHAIMHKHMQGDDAYPALAPMEEDEYMIPMPHKTYDADELAAPFIRVKEVQHPAQGEAPQTIRIATYNVQSLRRKGRAAQLQRLMKNIGLHIIALQETRTSGPSRRSTEEGFHILTSGCNKQHTSHGCELWMAKSINGVQTRKEDMQLLDYDPRWLVAKISCSVITTIVEVVHAPHRGHDDLEIMDHWSDISRMIAKYNRRNHNIMVLGDFNRLPTQGDMGQGGEPHHVDSFIEAEDLYIPYLWRAHNADGQLRATCYCSFGETTIDHIALGGKLWSAMRTCKVWTDDKVDIMMNKLDHIGVACEVVLDRQPHTRYHHRHELPYSLGDALEDKSGLANIIREAPRIPWEVNMDTHWHILQQHVVNSLTQNYPHEQKRKTPSWMKKDTVELIDVKAKLFSQMVRQRREGGQDEEWLDCAHDMMRVLTSNIKKNIARDRKHAMDEIAITSADAFSDHRIKEAYKQMRRLRPYVAKTVKPIRNKAGETATDIKEIDEAWAEHWTELLDMTPTSFNEVFKEASMKAPHDGWAADFFTKMPNINDVARAIATQRKGKMHGIDLIPSEIWQSDVQAAARHAYPLVVKMWMVGRRPTQWQGDTHATVPKSNGKHRGVALADAMSKAVNKVVRKMFIPVVEEQSVDTAYGAFAKKGTDFAIHTRTLATQIIRHEQTSAAMIFVDIISAFDEVRRRDIKAKADRSNPVMQQIVAGHEDTWVVTPHADSPHYSRKGVKQGDPVADATFLYILNGCLRRIRAAAQEMECCLMIPEEEGCLLTSRKEDDSEGPTSKRTPTTTKKTSRASGAKTLRLSDISFIDDICVMVVDRDPHEVLRKTNEMCKMVRDIVNEAGFRINDAPGKTEVAMLLRGEGSRKAKEELQDMDYQFNIGTHKIKVVEQYTHIGIPHSFDNEPGRVMTMVNNKMRTRIKDNQEHILKSKTYSLEQKQKAIDICVASACYASPAWTPMTDACIGKLNSSYMKMLRMASGCQYNPYTGIGYSDEQVRRMGNHIDLNDLLRLRRLQYLPRLLCHAPLILKMMVKYLASVDGSWTMLARQDLYWAWRNCKKLEELGNPMEGTETWEKYIASYPKAWKATLAQLRRQTMQGETCWEEKAGSFKVPGHYVCEECGKVCTTSQGLSLHAIRTHSRIALASFYARNAVCGWCQRDTGCRPRLLQHLRVGQERNYQEACLTKMVLHGFMPMTMEEHKEALRGDQLLAQANRRKGLHVARPPRRRKEEAGQLAQEEELQPA
eukprot:TRINITY_DN14510_c0_g1_i1.p1 TRINITY_DN14510_c0_g1~~TRINITY_DN14510_c0_g1_i1.p1  ORF type:complete len:1453 (+),score=255.34 TRINITY_DN14510_c0_g1_i1:1703-6061(+)